ncbi:hypothetical protein [Mucilaginibacter sp. CSA2-8R]|uniref:hypothetical protein n=1 Tax=Mucilaginibacter sp. CSA2-8R TaxID=3141542 RepID=UPI00315DE578
MTKRQTSEETKLESAWERAFNSQHYEIDYDTDIPDGFHELVDDKIDNITEDEWYPEAVKLMELRPHISVDALADQAASNFANKLFNTSGIKVIFKGGF